MPCEDAGSLDPTALAREYATLHGHSTNRTRQNQPNIRGINLFTCSRREHRRSDRSAPPGPRPERAPARGQRDERVHIRGVRPRARQRTLHAIAIEEEHSILPPRPPSDHEHELAAAPRMERMRHTNSSL